MVYVVVPDVEARAIFRVGSPHLAQPKRVADFTMEIAGAE
jgi:hypothetical protein